MNGLDIMADGTDKLTGVEMLLDAWGLSLDDVAAFGDNGNDFEMVNAAKEGYAMKNSAADLLQKVEKVTDYSNNDDGVQRKIDEYLG